MPVFLPSQAHHDVRAISAVQQQEAQTTAGDGGMGCSFVGWGRGVVSMHFGVIFAVVPLPRKGVVLFTGEI